MEAVIEYWKTHMSIQFYYKQGKPLASRLFG